MHLINYAYLAVKPALTLAGAAISFIVYRYHAELLAFLTGPGSGFRVLIISIVVLNYKSLPLMWHIRVLNGMLFHYMRGRNFDTITAGLSERPSSYPALFQPIITRSWTPLTECDYNLHKSNSTYFGDLDVAVGHCSCALFQQGFKKMQNHPETVFGPDGKEARGEWAFVLGATYCSFRRQIRPYEKYEMWTRLLCWDRKWFYFVTHFVKAGAIKPAGYTFEDGGWGFTLDLRTNKEAEKKEHVLVEDGYDSQKSKDSNSARRDKAIFATAVRKYVGKLGGLTVHPEVLIEASGLLPPNPGGWNTMSGFESQLQTRVTSKNLSDTATPAAGEWDWVKINAENAAGLVYGRHFAALDGLHNEFSGELRPALGVYSDPF